MRCRLFWITTGKTPSKPGDLKGAKLSKERNIFSCVTIESMIEESLKQGSCLLSWRELLRSGHRVNLGKCSLNSIDNVSDGVSDCAPVTGLVSQLSLLLLSSLQSNLCSFAVADSESVSVQNFCHDCALASLMAFLYCFRFSLYVSQRSGFSWWFVAAF